MSQCLSAAGWPGKQAKQARGSFLPQVWFNPHPITGLRLQMLCVLGSCSWGSTYPSTPKYLVFILFSGSQMGAQNASAQPGLRLSTRCLLLPGCRYPDAQLRAEPLVRSRLTLLLHIGAKKCPYGVEG